MARRRRKLGKGSLVIGGLVIIAIAVMFVMFPLITGVILGGVDSNDYRFAFPDIDNIILPTGQLVSAGSTFECFFKYTIVAKNVIGQVVQTQESDFNFNREIFVDLSISAPTGQTIEKYEVTPKIRCDKKTGDTTWGSGLVVLPSSIQLSVKIAQPDGTTTTLPTKSLTIQSTGADGTIIATGNDLFGVIPNINPFDDIAGILPDNQEIEFKGTLGALKSANEFWTIDANEIDNKLQALPDRYSSDVTFQVFAGSGTGLNIRNIFTEQTNYFPLFANTLSKSVFITVDKRADVLPSDTVQTISITSAITNSGSGQTIVGSNEVSLDPTSSTSERRIEVKAFLREYQNLVETIPQLEVTTLGGSRLSGTSPVTMFGGGSTGIFTGLIQIPSSINDGTYIFKVRNTRDQVGQATFTVSTPTSTTQPQDPPCDPNFHKDASGTCVPDSTTTCPSGTTQQSDGSCLASTCANGDPPLADGTCLIKVDVGTMCSGGRIEQPDGSCLDPACNVGFEWNTSQLRCLKIDCPISGQEFDITLNMCVTTSIVCTDPNEVIQNNMCVDIADVQPTTEGGVTPNILNIRQEIKYQIVTEDPLGGRTPVESGTIPKDTSFFAGITPLQFVLEPDPDGFAKRFGLLDVDSFLVIPSTVVSPTITNVDLNQQLHFYHDNPVSENGQLTKNEGSLSVNLPAGTLAEINTGIGGGFFQLGKFTITTSDILSAVTGVTGAFNCFEEGTVCTTVGGLELKDGDVISIIYTVDGTFDLTANAQQYNGVINQMKFFKNFIFSEAILAGNEACTGKSGKALLQCNFDETGNNSLEGVCPSDDMKTDRENFESCLATLDDSQVESIQQEICSDTDELARLVDLLNTGGGKSTEDILNDLKLAFGCVVEVEPTDGVDGDAFKCPSGTKAKSGITAPMNDGDCEVDNACDELPDGTKVVGGMIFTKTDGTQECVAPPVVTNGGTPMCQTGSTRDPATGQCTFPVKTNPEETIITGLLEALNKLLEGITGTNEGLSETGSESGGSTDGAGACLQNILNCALQVLGGDGEDEEPPQIIPPSLQVGGSQTSAFVIFSIIIIIIIATSAIIARSRRGRTRLG